MPVAPLGEGCDYVPEPSVVERGWKAARLIQMKSSARIVVRGMVQGVGFRYFVQHHATQLGVTGWVRNLPNGDVEIEAEGNRELLESLITCTRRGPRSAVVSDVDVVWKESRGQFSRFEIAF